MDQHEAHAEAIRSNNLLLKGTYEDGYKAGFKAGREAGMREAAGLCQSHEPKDFTTAGIMTRAKCAEVILSAIGGDK